MSHSIKNLWDNGNYYPALMLLYIMIDTGGWIRYGNKSSEKNFTTWCKDFILHAKLGGANENDLWSERCGLLHIFSHRSFSFVGNKARAAAYSFKGGDPSYIRKLARLKNIESKTVIIVADNLKDAVIAGFESMILEFDAKSADARQTDRIQDMNYYITSK